VRFEERGRADVDPAHKLFRDLIDGVQGRCCKRRWPPDQLGAARSEVAQFAGPDGGQAVEQRLGRGRREKADIGGDPVPVEARPGWPQALRQAERIGRHDMVAVPCPPGQCFEQAARIAEHRGPATGPIGQDRDIAAPPRRREGRRHLPRSRARWAIG